MYTYCFGEYAGYDLMFSGYQIFNKDKKLVLVVDSEMFFSAEEQNSDSFEKMRHAPNEKAESFAKMICARLNQ